MSFFIMFCLSRLIIMTVTDLKEKIVDCKYAIVLAVAGLIYAIFVGGSHCLGDAFFGGVLGFVIIELIARLGYLLKKGRAMGEADSYVAAALGTLVGFQDIVSVLLYAVIASVIFVLPFYWQERYKANDALTLFFSALFIICISFTVYTNSALWSVILLGITGCILTYFVLKNIHTAQKLNYLPFVPALSAGFLYYIFYVL